MKLIVFDRPGSIETGTALGDTVKIGACFTVIRFVGNGLHKTDYERIDEWIIRLQEWYKNGQLMSEVKYMNDKPFGLEKKWHEDGNLKTLLHWDGNGESIENSLIIYNKIGEEKKRRSKYKENVDQRLKYAHFLQNHSELLSEKHDIPGVTKRVDGELVE